MAHAYTHVLSLLGNRFISLSILYLFYVVVLHAIHLHLVYPPTGYGPRLLKPTQKPRTDTRSFDYIQNVTADEHLADHVQLRT